MKQIQQFDIEIIEAHFVDETELSITGSDPQLMIRRQGDGQYWNGTTFVPSATSVSMSAISNNEQPGQYKYSFDTTGLTDATYSMTAELSGALNSPQTAELVVGGFVDNLNASIQGILSSLPAQGGVINVQGVFTKQDREKLLEMIRDNFFSVQTSLNLITDQLETLKDQSRRHLSQTEDKISETGSKIDELIQEINEMRLYQDAQTELIKTLDCEPAGILEEIW